MSEPFDWDKAASEVVARNERMNDEAQRSPRYLAKREKLAAEIEAGVFDGEIEYDDEDSDDEDYPAHAEA